MTQQPIGIGVIGVGGMAMAFHVPAVERTGQAHVVAICDVNKQALAAAAALVGNVETYTAYEDLLANPRVDAVIIATSNDLHAPISLAALSLGKHVLCEKPLALSVAEALSMQRAAAASGLVAGVNFSYRNNPGVRFVADVLARGEIGAPTFLTLHYLQGYLADPHVPITWRRQQRYAGSGVLGDLGSHMVDLSRLWIGEITAVTAHTRIFTTERPDAQGAMSTVDTDDAVTFACDFAGGAMGVITSAAIATGHRNDQRAQVYGPQGAIIYENSDQTAVQALFGQTAARYGLFGRLPIPSEYHQPDRNHVAGFVTAIREGRPMTPSFEDGLRCQQVLDAARESAETGQRVIISPLA